jgi:hypothetical protein
MFRKKKFWLAGAPSVGGGGGPTPGTEALAFLARTIGLDTPHTTMYINLINGLVADSVWAKLDALYFFATDTTTNALFNLKSATLYNASAHGSLTFTANQGYAGVDGSGTAYLDSAFNPSTAGGNFQQNAAHVSAWSNTNAQSGAGGGGAIGIASTSSSNVTEIYPRYPTNTAYFRINDGTGSTGAANSSSIGFFVATRSGISTQNGYINAVDQGITSVASGALVNATIAMLGFNFNPAGHNSGSGLQYSAASIGGSLTPTDVTNLYARLGTARTAVGL